jgi:hypothetical protein
MCHTGGALANTAAAPASNLPDIEVVEPAAVSGSDDGTAAANGAGADSIHISLWAQQKLNQDPIMRIMNLQLQRQRFSQL